MAKTTTCAICGKEITKGLLKGEDRVLTIGDKFLTCCEDCYQKYEDDAKLDGKRFSTKVDNIAKTTKTKFNKNQIGEMLVKYFEEAAVYEQNSKNVNFEHTLNSFWLSNDGHFSVREYGKGFMNTDITAREMLKSIKKAQRDTECFAFTKDDITKIEYAKMGSGDFNGLFQKVYSFAIRLNDEKLITYKPCVTRMVSYGGGFGFGYQKNAEKRLLRILDDFQKAIGSNFEVVKVKKI